LLALGGVVWLVWPGNELHLRTPARWRHRRTGRRQPEVLKNGLDRAAFFPPSMYPPTATTCACWIIRLPHFGDQRRRSRAVTLLKKLHEEFYEAVHSALDDAAVISAVEATLS